MSDFAIILPQDQETVITTRHDLNCELRYAYARSNESRISGEKGQDSLAVKVDRGQICFVLCDGVSMSFMGDLAAAFLSSELLGWLPELSEADMSELDRAFTTFLMGLTAHATDRIRAYELPTPLAPVVRSVLEQKRQLGSESMFVCGRFDFAADHLLLAWLGDSRLRIWKNHSEQTEQLFGQSFHTRERWSSQRGCIGQVHTWQSPITGITRLVVYSDGLAILDGKMETVYMLPALKQIIQKVDDLPNSDDISYFELILHKKEGA